MSAVAKPDPPNESGAASKSKKKKNKKKGAGGGANKTEDVVSNVNGKQEKPDGDDEDQEEEEEEEPSKPAPEPPVEPDDVEDEEQPLSPTTIANGTNHHSISSAVALGISRSQSQGGMSRSPPPPQDAAARLDAMAKERDSLRQEVTELRQSLESIQGKHQEDLSSLQGELEEANESKDHFESQYRTLLGRVNQIKSSLGERLKKDAASLEEAHGTIAELEEQNKELQQSSKSLTEELATLREQNEAQTLEVSNLRGRANVSQQNWIQERDDLIAREAAAREDFENAKQAMQDWEALALNERSLHDNVKERILEMGEQLESLQEAHQKAVSDRDTNSQAVDGLQKALQEIQNERKTERRQLVDKYEADLSILRKQVQAAEEAAALSQSAMESTQKELERALPFEREVKEKNLLIGKLRHEAVTLNEHLTKALRILKKGRPEDNVDRQIVSNYILHFLAIDRSDPKKFEALQLIASLLSWNDEQREQAGLSRPGASNSSLRIPLSPFRRVPSTPSLNSSLNADPMLLGSSSSNKESLAELWSDFLEREAVEGGNSRRGSQATSPPPRSDTGSGLGITEK